MCHADHRHRGDRIAGPRWTADTFDGSYDDGVIRVWTDSDIGRGIAEVDSVPSVIRAIIEAPSSHTHARGSEGVGGRSASTLRDRRRSGTNVRR